MAAGSISACEFKSLLVKFVDISDKINDGWHLEKQDGLPPFATKKCIIRSDSQTSKLGATASQHENATGDTQYNPSTCDDLKKNMESSQDLDSWKPQEANESVDKELEIEDETDTQCLPSMPEQILTYEYHIVYSDSYQVPVLYFNVYKTDGSLLSLDHVWSLCPSWHQEMLKESKWTTLTQQEHPLLGRPFLQLHPCHTEEFMSQVLKSSNDSNSKNYLVTWLSTVAPMVGLTLSPQYAQR